MAGYDAFNPNIQFTYESSKKKASSFQIIMFLCVLGG